MAGKRSPRRPLVALLLERGLFAGAEDARRWVMAGQVLVDGRQIDKPGTPVPTDAVLTVRGRQRFASRGGLKLEAALDHFGVCVGGRVALDCGASTGGFTDCLLQRGARLVYAVDTGYGQLLGRLRVEPRVRNLERTNLGDLSPEALEPRPSLVTLDLSYLSLGHALPLAAPLLAGEGDVLALLKPLFEINDPLARRKGLVTDPTLLVLALRQALDAGRAAGLTPLGAVRLALRPRHGVHEYFLHLARRPDLVPWEYDVAALATLLQVPGVGPAAEDADEVVMGAMLR